MKNGSREPTYKDVCTPQGTCSSRTTRHNIESSRRATAIKIGISRIQTNEATSTNQPATRHGAKRAQRKTKLERVRRTSPPSAAEVWDLNLCAIKLYKMQNKDQEFQGGNAAETQRKKLFQGHFSSHQLSALHAV